MRQPTILILLCTLLLATSGTEPNFVVAPRPGKDYALLIAVNNYQNSKLLDFANPQGNPKKDAQEIEQLLKDQNGFSTERLLDPTAAEIIAKLEQYERDFRSGAKDPNGQLFLFFSGHGEREYGNGFFLAADADPTKLYEKSLPYALWRPRIANFNCKHIMVVIDACYSGTFDPNWFNRPKSYGTRPGELDAIAKLQANYDVKKTRMFFTSATEVRSPEISSFAKKFKEGLLSGGGTDGILTSTELFSSLELSSPRPHRGEFEQDEAGSAYLFFSQSTSVAPFDLSSYEQRQRDIQAWKTAQTKNTPAAYLDYQQKFPQGTFREDARKALTTAEEDQEWELARLRNTSSSYQAYLTRYPSGRYATEAKKNLQPTAAPDRDRDGVPDSSDRCPDQFGPSSNNGCPLSTSESSYDDPYAGSMVLVKGGTFQMGDANGESDEKPVHSVSLNDFYIGKTEVTQAQWRAVMGSDPPELIFKGYDQCPVERVSWNDAQEFIKKLNAKTGKTYRLPTEAEWEYAARGGGKQTYTYAGSNTVDEVAWYDSNAGSKTHPVGEKKANELGLYDMSGNVREWCQDWYGSDYYAKSPSSNPQGPSTGSSRVIRGGSWYYTPANVRVAIRYRYTLGLRNNDLGFRLARQQ